MPGFEDSELHMLIDGVLSSKYITAKHSKDIINRLCGLSNKYFRSNVKHIHSVNDWYKTDNQALFYNIELIDTAIEEGKQVHYDYNKYGTDKKLHKSSHQYVTPYLMVLHNQRYYLMAYSEYWGNMVFHRLDRITNMIVVDKRVHRFVMCRAMRVVSITRNCRLPCLICIPTDRSISTSLQISE